MAHTCPTDGSEKEMKKKTSWLRNSEFEGKAQLK